MSFMKLNWCKYLIKCCKTGKPIIAVLSHGATNVEQVFSISCQSGGGIGVINRNSLVHRIGCAKSFFAPQIANKLKARYKWQA